MQGVANLYRHRHAFPFWNEEEAGLAGPVVAYYGFGWVQSHDRFSANPNEETLAELRQDMLLLGLAAWWALNRLSDELYQPEQLDVAGRAEEVDVREEWQTADRPLSAWRNAVLGRLASFAQTLSARLLDSEEERALLRRQLLFIAYQAEQAVSYVDSRAEDPTGLA